MSRDNADQEEGGEKKKRKKKASCDKPTHPKRINSI